MRSSRLIATALLCGLGALCASGCAPRITIRSIRPGPISLGAADHLAILDGSGRRSAREVVYLELENQCRSRGYFTVADLSDEGHRVTVMGRKVRFEGGSVLDEDQVGLRIDVVEWRTDRREDSTTQTVLNGDQAEEITEVIVTRTADVVLGVTAFHPDGRAALAEKEYEGHYESTDPEFDKYDLLEAAARDVIGRFLNDISPVWVTQSITLDNSDPAQNLIIQIAQKGSIAEARREMREYFDANPESPSACYNLACFSDGMGDHDEALELYDRAMSLGGQAFYVEARAQCAQRKAALSAFE